MFVTPLSDIHPGQREQPFASVTATASDTVANARLPSKLKNPIMNSNSPWDDPRITAYVMNELSGDARVAFEAELKTKPDLSAAVDDARRVTDRLSGMFAAESTPPLSLDRREGIASGAKSSTESNRSETHRTPSRSWKIPMLVLGTAAVVALLIGIAPMLNDEPVTVSQVETDASHSSLESELREMLTETTDVTVVEQKALSIEERPIPVSIKPMATNADSASRSLAAPRAENGLTIPIAKDKRTGDTDRPNTDRDMRLDGMSMGGMDTGMAEIEGMDVAMGGGMGGSEEMGSAMGMDSVLDEYGMLMQNAPNRKSRVLSDSSASNEFLFRGNVEYQSELPATPFAAEPSPSSRGGVRSAIELPRSIEPSSIQVTPRFGRDANGRIDSSGDKFSPITENDFKRASEEPLSTFSIDVDTASYSKVRDILVRANQLPRPDAVRIEEMVNYFNYHYSPPPIDAEHPFDAQVEITACPWNDQHRLARIGIQGKTMKSDERPRCNLVFLVDTSGSMNSPHKLPLVIEGMQMLAKQLEKGDRVAIVVYAGSAGLVLDSTSAKRTKKINQALSGLAAGGSTNGGAGIELAYQTARENFVDGGVNRVILCSDGDFNVGTTGTDALVRLVENEAKSGVFLTVLGFGMGNHNDAMMEQISGRGNGNYAFIDNSKEARKVLVEQASGTLVTIAKDVKLQVDFNPAKVASYRLIGYENRMLATEDFNDDKKDAGEIGAGHSVTALYEIVPVGVDSDPARPKIDESKYTVKPAPIEEAGDVDVPTSNETLTVRIRYKQPDGDTSTRVDFPITDDGGSFDAAGEATRFAASVAGFAMQLRRSEHAGDWTMTDVLETAKSSRGSDEDELRSEFIQLVEKASELKGER